MATIIDFENNESRLESVEYTLNNITGGGYNYDLSAKSIKSDTLLVFPPKSNIVNDKVETNNNLDYYSLSSCHHIIGNYSTLNFRGAGSVTHGFYVISDYCNVTIDHHFWATMISGSNNVINVNNNGGNIISSSGTTINKENTCNIILGRGSKLDGSKIGGNAMLGDLPTINCLTIGNLLCSTNTILTENALSQQNGFWSILSLSADSKQIEEIKNRLGIVFVSAKDTKNGGNLYYSNVLTAPIYVHGYQQYTESANVMDSDGNYLIQNGKSTLEKRIETLEEEIAQLKQLLNR